jgi:hypothetical protein
MTESGRRKPGGTLASAVDSKAVIEAAPDITVADVPRPVARAVAPGVVIALVAVALGVGFLLGWAVRGL